MRIGDVVSWAAKHSTAPQEMLFGDVFGDALKKVFGDALKKVNISLDKLITVLMSNGLSPLYGIADPSRAYS